jgi:hypothetical protein
MRLTRQTLRLAAIVLMMASFSACSLSNPIDHHGTELKVDHIYQGDMSSKSALADIDGKVALLYATVDNRVAFRLGDQTTLLDANLKVKGGKFFQLKQYGNTVYALWWSHQDGKALYCAVSADGGKTFGPTQVVNTDHGALPPFTLLSSGEGVASVVYMDERTPRYEIYFNRSTDAGKAWSKQDQRLDTAPKAPEPSSAMFPQMVQSGKEWVVAWTDTAKIDGQVKGRVLVRTSADQGQQWTPEKVIYQSTSALYSMHAKAVGDAVVILLQDTLKGVVALQSSDQGKTWADLGGAPESQTANNSGIRIAGAGQTVYAVWMAQKDNKSKGQVMASELDLTSGKWNGKPQQIDVGKPVNQTLSLDPHITVTGSGTAVISWTDFRNIRPNIYLSASFDQGKTWSVPQDVESPGQYSSLFSELMPRKNSVLVSYERFTSDDHKTREALVVDVALDKGVGFSGLPKPKTVPTAEKEKLLKDRVEAFWKLRVDGDFGKTYAYFDPAFRSFTPEKDFDKSQGNVTYHSAKLEKFEIDGNVAQVSEKVNYEVKKMEVMGHPVTVPPTEAHLVTPWVWIYDNWYMVYQPVMGGPLLQY